jgi:hypothetical protein
MSRHEGLFWLGFTGLAGFLVIGSVLLANHDSSPPPRVTPRPASYDPGPASAAPVRAPALSRIQLKTGANVRNGPSRNAAILRVGRQGEVFTKFSEANGWLQVGTSQPEGWVAQSVVAPLE